jgi:hypothetical protein
MQRLQQNRLIPNSSNAFSELSPFSKYSLYGLYASAISFPQEKHLIGIIMVSILKNNDAKYIIF